MWFQADSLALSDGDPISTWTDSTGNGHDATAGGAQRPTYRASGGSNNEPYVEFDGSDDQMTIDSGNPSFATGWTQGEMFVVVKLDADPPASNSSDAGVVQGLGGTGFSLGARCEYPDFDSGDILEGFGNGNGSRRQFDPGVSLASWRLYNVSSQSGEYKARIDGTEVYSNATNTVSFAESGPRLCQTNSLARMDGQVHEVLIYDAVLSSGDRSIAEDYLAGKYNLTIA